MEEENRGISIMRSIGRSLSRAAAGDGGGGSRSNSHRMEDEEALRWAALEKLSTYNRIRTTIFNHAYNNNNNINHDDKLLLEVRDLDPNAQQHFIDNFFKVAEDDNERFLTKFRNRVDKVGITLPTVEVRFQNLSIEADCYVGNRALPSLPNATRNSIESFLGSIGISFSKKTKITILKDVSGIIKPSRMVLLLGPPSSGKTTLLLALAGKLDPNLKVEGEITYNGHKLTEFVPQKTSAYISQNDVHVGEMTVKETFQIVRCLQQIAHLTESTIFMSLLQPAPETFDLFDDIILLSEGQIIYQGPRVDVLDFFEDCGFKCPVSEFAQRFNHFHVGEKLNKELSVPYDKSQSHKAALVFKKYMVSKSELLKASWDKEWLLMKRNSFIYIFKTVQFTFIAFVGTTLYLRTTMHRRNEQDGQIYVGAILLSLLINLFNGIAEISLTIIRLPVIFKQRDLLFHPPWAYTLPTFLLRLPICMLESIIWMAILYYGVDLAPEASRFFKHFLLVFMVQNVSGGMFRLIAGVCRTMNIANTGGILMLLLIFLLGGFLVTKSQIPNWWEWAYWLSPLSYGFNAFTINEFFADRWINKMSSDGVTSLGIAMLRNLDVPRQTSFFWIGAAALLGFAVVFNILFTLVLTYLVPPGRRQATISKEAAEGMEAEQDTNQQSRLKTIASKRERVPQTLFAVEGSSSNESTEMQHVRNRSESYDSFGGARKKGTVFPFTPLAMSFDSMNYFVDMPQEMKEQGVTENRLQLLREVTGAFRPGVLTALMGVSGAGKTTLMDVLAGRKTGGYIEGDIRISGFPKKQETFARISGYCEQTDIHSPQITVHESLIYSAFLRLPKEFSDEEKMIFVSEVMELVELDNLKDAIVGLPGVSGLSTEQRKRLTIAVELVANPSIIFMDEPTSGLDARAAAIVMRTVRNTVDTGRTVVCTIHQPSIDIFESFDELLLMKRGGQVIYAGPLGRNSQEIVDYFEEIPGVPKMPEKYNPATWMLEVSSGAAEVRLGIDFAEYYNSSALQQKNKALVMQLSTPPPGATDLHFGTRYSQSAWGQFKSCIWKMWRSYWRNPDYNLTRNFFTLAAALMVGTIFWKIGEKRESSNNLSTIIGATFSGVFFVGMNNCQTVQPVIATERIVFYRERAAGMYSELPYAMAQMFVEMPYVFFEATYYTLIVYAMVSFEWTAAKFFWSFFINFFSFLYFTYYGMMTVSITPNEQLAAIVAGSFYAIFCYFSGFFIPRPRIPKWWTWYYWICPLAWSVYGSIVSQYHDVENTIKVPGMSYDPAMNSYIEDYYGYRLDFMGPVAAILVGFCVLFAFVYAYCLRTLNFQVR